MSATSTRIHRREPKASPASNKSASAEVLSIVSPAIAPNAEEAAREAFYASAEANASEAPARLGDVTIEENSITSEDVLSLLAEIASPDVRAPAKGNKISREEFRYVKNAVEVDGVRYSSVYKAFLALGLPVGRHIGFRAKLKTAGALAFVNEGRTYGFKVI